MLNLLRISTSFFGKTSLTKKLSLISSTPDGPLSWVKCPNGHAYAIGECGRPTHEAKCVTCKAPIGGARYNVFVGTGLNLDQTARAALADETKTGHILGPAIVGTRYQCFKTFLFVVKVVAKIRLCLNEPSISTG
jgi:hypothetical protein